MRRVLRERARLDLERKVRCVPAGAIAGASAGGMAAGDAAGGGDSGSGDCGHDGFLAEDGVPDGAGGTEPEDQPGAAGTDGAGARMRSGVRAGAVGAFAGGSGDGAGGAGDLEETIYDAASEQGSELAGLAGLAGLAELAVLAGLAGIAVRLAEDGQNGQPRAGSFMLRRFWVPIFSSASNSG